MKKNTFLIYFLIFSLILPGILTAGGKDGRKNLESPRKVLNIANLDHIVNNPPVLFLSSLAESFEGSTFPPAGWIQYRFPGSTDPGWTRITAGTTPLPGWNGGIITTPPGGGNAVAFVTYNASVSSNDEWLVTPQLTNIQANDSLYFWLQKPGYTGAYLDNMDIMISTTTNAMPSFTISVANLVFPANSSDTLWALRSYKIGNLVPAGSNIYIAWREHVIDNLNDGAAFSLDLVSITGLPLGIHNSNSEIPKSFSLEQNYPNPFNPTTNIKFGLPSSGRVKLAVYDILGSRVAVLIDGYKNAGNYVTDFNASNLASGIYFYKLESNDFVSTKRMILIK